MKLSSVPAYTMGAKFPAEPLTTDKLSPAPGTYNVRAEEIIVPTYSFSKAQRSFSAVRSNFPGPGAYPLSHFLDASSSKLKKRKSKRLKDKSEKSNIETPGPSSYYPSKPKTAIAYSMGNNTFALMASETNQLGPGQYDPNFSAIKPATANSFTRAPKMPENTELKVPGPGTYEVSPGKSSPQVAFTREARGKKLKSDYPGPGEYYIPGLTDELRRKMGKSMLSKSPITTNEPNFPGPGAYFVKDKRQGPAFSVGRGKRTEIAALRNTPGPGNYEQRTSALGNKSKSFGTGIRPGIAKANGFPGPGAYNSRSFIEEGPKYSLVARKNEVKSVELLPGPGQYNPEIGAGRAEPTHAVIGTGQRTNENRRGIRVSPGPGAYEFESRRNGPKWSFKKDAKEKASYEDEPGPGQYEIPTTIPDVPKYLLNNANNK
jgi:hypothetical protein